MNPLELIERGSGSRPTTYMRQQQASSPIKVRSMAGGRNVCFKRHFYGFRAGAAPSERRAYAAGMSPRVRGAEFDAQTPKEH